MPVAAAAAARAAYVLPAPDVLEAAAAAVLVGVERGPKRNSRRVVAGLDIAAPLHVVWGALTDYDNLAAFVPALETTTVETRDGNRVVVTQVGRQELGLGLTFSAAATLECEEFLAGPAPEAYTGMAHLPAETGAGDVSDITFALVQSRDLAGFDGVWRLSVPGSDDVTRLSYVAEVSPQPWLPVGLIQGRIEWDCRHNLAAVRLHAERLWRARD